MQEKDFNTIFSNNLLHFLQINNMTQAELAERLNVSTATTSNWCKGVKLPRMDKIDKMCKIFGCLRSDLMEDKPLNFKNEISFLLTPLEKKIIIEYRQADDISKAMVQRALNINEVDHQKKEGTA